MCGARSLVTPAETRATNRGGSCRSTPTLVVTSLHEFSTEIVHRCLKKLGATAASTGAGSGAGSGATEPSTTGAVWSLPTESLLVLSKLSVLYPQVRSAGMRGCVSTSWCRDARRIASCRGSCAADCAICCGVGSSPLHRVSVVSLRTFQCERRRRPSASGKGLGECVTARGGSALAPALTTCAMCRHYSR